MTSRIDPPALLATLRRVKDTSGPHDLDTALQQLVDTCVRLLPITGCGIMLLDDEHDLRYTTASNQPARDLEHAQLATGTGPCIDAYLIDTVVTVSDLATDPRWPELADQLGANPVRAVLGVPIHFSGLTVGSFDVYRPDPHDWSVTDREAVVRFATVIDTLLGAAVNADNAGVLAAQLTYALNRRASLERAIGYLMADRGLDSSAAFRILRSHARNHRRRVSDVADDLLTTGRLPTTTPTGSPGTPPLPHPTR